MKELIDKSEHNFDSVLEEKWKPLLVGMGFKTEHMNLAMEYCNFHANCTIGYGASWGDENSKSLLAMCLSILNRLDLDSVREYYITDRANTVSVNVGKLPREIPNDIETIESFVVDAVAGMINQCIAASENKVLELGIIVQSINTVAEGTLPVQVYAKSRITVR